MPKYLKSLLAYISLNAQGVIPAILVIHVATYKLKLMNTSEPIKFEHLQTLT